MQSEAESVVQPSTDGTTESVSELPETEIDEQPSADEDCGADCYYSSGDEYVPRVHSVEVTVLLTYCTAIFEMQTN